MIILMLLNINIKRKYFIIFHMSLMFFISLIWNTLYFSISGGTFFGKITLIEFILTLLYSSINVLYYCALIFIVLVYKNRKRIYGKE